MTAIHALPERAPLEARADARFDQVAVLARRVLKVPTASVTLVARTRQVFPGASGMAEAPQRERQTPLSHSICQHVVIGRTPLTVPDLRADDRFASNGTVTEYGAGAYAGVPLTDVDDAVIGSLCVMDDEPREWTPDELATLADLAAVCSAELKLRGALTRAAVAADRDRIAQDLHRDVIGDLLSLSMLLGSARSGASGRTGEQLDEAMSGVQQAIRRIRDTVFPAAPR